MRKAVRVQRDQDAPKFEVQSSMLSVRCSPRFRDRSGFTMLELLLVVAIMLIAAGLSVPSFIRSFRGAKLRTSVRTVVMTHRYARSMAVLKQTEVAILFDTKKNEIEVVSVASSSQDERNRFLDARGERTGVRRVDEQATPTPSGGVTTEQLRPLEEGVRLTQFDNPGGAQEKDGIYWVRYYSNGMCDPYTVRLVDEYDKAASVQVDSISGKAMVEYE